MSIWADTAITDLQNRLAKAERDITVLLADKVLLKEEIAQIRAELEHVSRGTNTLSINKQATRK